jgi:hypothetical protein
MSEHFPPETSERRWGLGFLSAVTAALVLAAGGVWLWIGHQRQQALFARLEAHAGSRLAEAENKLNVARAEAERLDGPWQMEDIAARLEEIPDVENAGLTLRAVTAKVPPDWQAYGWSGGIPIPTSPVLLHPQEVEIIRRQWQDAAAAITLARTIADQPRGRIPLPWTQSFHGALGVTPDLGQAPQMLMGDATLLAHDGDLEGALRSCRAFLNAGTAIGNTPTFAAQLFRCDHRAALVGLLERVLALGEPPDAALSAMQTRLIQEAKLPLMLMAARGERAALDRLCQAMHDGQVSPASIFGDYFWEHEKAKIDTGPSFHRTLCG